MPKVSIIILVWNGWDDAIECVKSVEKIDYPNFNIIVVDNGSEESRFHELYREFPNIKLIATSKNLGFAGGNNVGIKFAIENGAEYALILNNDTVVKNDFLTKLVEALESDSGYGIAGPVIYYYDKPERIWFAGGRIDFNNLRKTHLGLDRLAIEAGFDGGYRIVEYITGCCLLIKKEVINKIGLMDEDYFLYYEDVDWNLRARKAGYKSVLVTGASIYHKCSRSSKEGSYSYIYYHYRNGLLLALKVGSFRQRMSAYLESIITFKVQIMKYLLFPSRRKWARAAMRGIKDFYMGKFGKLKK